MAAVTIKDMIANVDLYNQVESVMKKGSDKSSKADSDISDIDSAFEAIGVKRCCEFIASLLDKFMYPIELIVKEGIVTGLAQILGCSMKDFHIPNELREHYFDYNASDDRFIVRQGKGLTYGISEIDVNGKLSKSPFIDYYSKKDGDSKVSRFFGKTESLLYYGVNQEESVYRLSRAKDFDAFLWYVMRKCSSENASAIHITGTTAQYLSSEHKCHILDDGKTNLLLPCTIGCNVWFSSIEGIEIGTVLSYEGENVLFLCDSLTEETEGVRDIRDCHIVPYASSSAGGANWYAGVRDLGDVSGWKPDGEDIQKDGHAILNMRYYSEGSSRYRPSEAPEGVFNFTIAAKPFYHTRHGITQGNGFNPLSFGRVAIRFDENGNPDKKGHFSCYCTSRSVSTGEPTVYTYDIVTHNGNPISGFKLSVTERGNNCSYEITGSGEKSKCLYECYAGDTMFEFNQSYVDSMRFFDTKSILAQTLGNFVNGMGVSFSPFSLQSSDDVIREAIDRIFTSVTQSDSDCYFSFSNADYDTLVSVYEKSRAYGNAYVDFDAYSELIDAIGSLSDDSEMVSKVVEDCVKTMSVTEYVPKNSEDGVIQEGNSGFFSGVLNAIYTSFVMSLFTPKVMLLLNVNKSVMGDYNPSVSLSWERILGAMSGVIKDIAISLKNKMLEWAGEFIISVVKDISLNYFVSVAKEQAEAYYSLIRNLIENCTGGVEMLLSLIPNRKVTSSLDEVTNADIDYLKNNGDDISPTRQC